MGSLAGQAKGVDLKLWGVWLGKLKEWTLNCVGSLAGQAKGVDLKLCGLYGWAS